VQCVSGFAVSSQAVVVQDAGAFTVVAPVHAPAISVPQSV
jgi:hypothetical protein